MSGEHVAAIHATMCRMARADQLSEGEQSVLILHPHWKTLLRPSLILVVVVAAALTLEVVIPAGRVSQSGIEEFE